MHAHRLRRRDALLLLALPGRGAGQAIYTDFTLGALGDFACPKSGALTGHDLAEHAGVAAAAECARLCKADIDCVSFDFSAGRRRCVLGADIEGADAGVGAVEADGAARRGRRCHLPPLLSTLPHSCKEGQEFPL